MSERSNIRGFSEDLAKTPGPARYGSTDNNIYLKKNPQELAQYQKKKYFGLQFSGQSAGFENSL